MDFLKGYKTYLGVIMVGIAFINNKFGIGIGEGEVVNIIDGIIGLGGTILAIYGRARAK